MIDIRTTAISSGIALLIGSASAWWLTAEYKDNKWLAKVEANNIEASRQLQVATEKIIETERKHQAIATQLEIQNANKQTQLDKVHSDNRRLASKLGGLRDPWSRESCPSTVSASSGASKQSASKASSNRLSAEASEFLLEFARDADRAGQYANTCYEWIQGIKR